MCFFCLFRRKPKYDPLVYEFKSTNPWRKTNYLPKKDEWVVADCGNSIYVVANRVGCAPWKTDGSGCIIKPLRVLALKDVPEGLWKDNQKKGDRCAWIRHPETMKWLNVTSIS